MKPKIIKPKENVFVSYRFFVRSLIWLIVFVVGYFFASLEFQGIWVYFVAGFILVEAVSYYSLKVQYTKEKYTFFDDRIVHSSGGIFSDSETELVIRNITHVTMKLPFIQNKLFGTGRIDIEAAGSAQAEIKLRNIRESEQVYEYIQKIMKRAGFSLKKKKLVQTETPSTIGVFLETFQYFFYLLIIILYLLLEYGTIPVVGNIFYLFGFAGVVAMGMILLIILTLATTLLVFKFLDLKRRVYNLYSDTITYTEGFLSKNYSFIPIENLSDAVVKQTFLEQILGLYDVKLSCIGVGQEIHFKHMRNARKLEKNIDNLIAKTKTLIRPTKVSHKEVRTHTKAMYKSKISRDIKFKAEYKMDMGKSLVVVLLWLLFVPFIILLGLVFPIIFVGLIYFGMGWFVYFITVLMRVSATKYFIKRDTVESQYHLFTTKHLEFAYDKVMCVVFKESFIDKWFGTCSISFWSIGAGESIVFSAIKKSDKLYEKILAKVGIRKQQELYKLESKFKTGDMFKATFWTTVLSVLLLIGLFVAALIWSPLLFIPMILWILLYIVAIVYKHYYYKTSKLTFFKDYVYFTKGIFFVEHYYAPYDNIKDIETLKYPFSGLGYITFNVAGEQMPTSDERTSLADIKIGSVASSFTINYIQEIDNKDELVDLIFYRRPSTNVILKMVKNINAYSPKPVLTSKPDLGNSVAVLLIVSVICFPLIVILPITLPLVIWSVKVKSYVIQPYRVYKKSGIVYKRQKSIVFNKIDHVSFGQGFLNKVFRNGTIVVNTTGSSTAELNVRNIPNFKHFYELIKKYYQGYAKR